VSSVNSVAHWLGDATFDDKLTPRDHWLTGLLTLGEGYHNFHHQFPMDYRNGVKWYHFDSTKWIIGCCKQLGLASNLKVRLGSIRSIHGDGLTRCSKTFSQNEIQKSQFTMQLKTLRKKQDNIVWPTNTNDLPVINWKSCESMLSLASVLYS
jgi:stearoyl-CoA desaturase (delta-9 desaturase)